MAHLEGIAGIDPPPTLEFLPYVTSARSSSPRRRQGNPFNDGSRFFAGAGLDLKYGVSSSLTLDATFNPDFGQVEVDPAVVNLTQFETFFEERRPFFTEGAKVFGNFGSSGASQYWGFFRPEPTLFYSRRIGRAPQGRVVGRLHRRRRRDDDSRRGEAGRPDAQRLDARRAGGGDRHASTPASPTASQRTKQRGRAAHQLHRASRAARARPARGDRRARDVGHPRPQRPRARRVPRPTAR